MERIRLNKKHSIRQLIAEEKRRFRYSYSGGNPLVFNCWIIRPPYSYKMACILSEIPGNYQAYRRPYLFKVGGLIDVY